jgi:hypothetical protein
METFPFFTQKDAQLKCQININSIINSDFTNFRKHIKTLNLEVGTRVETLESRSRVGTLDLDRTPRDSRNS